MRDTTAAILIRNEYLKATKNHTKFNSAHEGYAVILEEVDELKAEIWKKREHRNMDKMREEAIQIGAMAMRFLTDLCDEATG
jgi:hypothetical protein